MKLTNLKDFDRKTETGELLRLCWGVVGNLNGEVGEVTMEVFESRKSRQDLRLQEGRCNWKILSAQWSYQLGKLVWKDEKQKINYRQTEFEIIATNQQTNIQLFSNILL